MSVKGAVGGMGLTVLLFLSALSGCDAEGERDASKPSGAMGLATYPATGEGSDGASLEGILERRDGCLVVVAPPVGTDDTERVVLPVFPAPSAKVVDGAVEWNGHRAEIGGQVDLTGGYLGPGRIEEPMFRVPEECAWATGDGFIVGNV